MNAPPRKPLFERLKEGLEAGIRHARGEIELRSTVLAEAPPVMTARDIGRLRKTLHVTEQQFARMLNVPLKTVRSWELGDRKPAHAALRLLQVLASKPEAVCEIVGVPFPVQGNGKKERRQ